MPNLVRVYLLDDHEVVRRGLTQLLGTQPDFEVVGQSASAARAVIEIAELQPDIAVLDVRLGDGSGIEVCREVRSQNADIKCLMLTSYDDDEALFAALMAGATGYLLKEVDGSALVAGIRGAAEGRSVMDAAATARVLERLKHSGNLDDGVPHELASLTPTERQILALISEGMTNRQIGERIYLAEKTVKNNVTSILAKLGLARRTQAAVFASRLR